MKAALGAVLLAGTGGAAAVVLTTSGPFGGDGDGDRPAVQVAATMTVTATPTPARDEVQATPTSDVPLPTGTATRAPEWTPTPGVQPPAQGPVDAEGWPVLNCEPGTSAYRLKLRRISACTPTGWIARDQDWQSVPGRATDYFADGSNWYEPGRPAQSLSLRFISRQSVGSRDDYEPNCASKSAITLLGLPGVKCNATWDEPNGTLLHPAYGWYTYLFVETDGAWIIAEATGTERNPGELETVRAEALEKLLLAAHNGVGRVTP